MLIFLDGNTRNAQLFVRTINTYCCCWILAAGTLLPASNATKLVKDLSEQRKHQGLDPLLMTQSRSIL
ncbi:hypothetical protein AgCh_019565 [Apium graveolens]